MFHGLVWINWIIGPLASFSMYHVGKGRRWAWVTTFIVQCGMLVVGIELQLYGFVIMAMWNAPVAARNWIRWRKRVESSVVDMVDPGRAGRPGQHGGGDRRR